VSASEKLKALEKDVATIQEVLTEALACDALDRISSALPQIVVVVEAAEAIDLEDSERQIAVGTSTPLNAALAALGEALA